MDAVFVNPLPGGVGLNQATIEPPLGLAYLAAVLERDGYTCRIIDANALGLTTAQVMAQVPSDVKLVGLYVNSFSYDSAKALATAARAVCPESTVVLGGPLASAIPEQLLEEMPCDGVVRGEGEDAVAAMMANMSAGRPAFDGSVPGAVYRDEVCGEVVQVPPKRITDLDRLPFPAYHLLPPLRTYKSRVRKTPMAAMVTTRGCPYQCSFCSQDVFQRRVSYRSPQNVLAEIDHLVGNFGVRQIDVLDDNFALKRERVDAILDGLIDRGYDLVLNLQLGVRPELLDDALLAKMKQAGVYKLGFGIESADPDVLRLARKGLDLQKTTEVVRSAKRLGLITYGFFIVGLPGETEEAFQRTLDFARRTDFDVANFCMAVPFIGTELYRQVESGGRFLVDTRRNISSGFYGGSVFFEYGDVTQEELFARYKRAYRAFYSLGKKLKMALTIRSWAEFWWHVDAAKFVLKGMLVPKTGAKAASRESDATSPAPTTVSTSMCD